MASLRQQYYKSYIEFKQSDAFKSLSAEERAQINKTAKETYKQLSDDEAPMLEGQDLRDQRGVLSNVVTDLTAGVVNLGRAGVSGAAWASDVAGFPDAARSLDEKSQQMGETAQMISPPADPNRLVDFGSQALLQNIPTLAAGGALARALTGSAAGGAILNNARTAAGIPAMAGAAPLTEGAASFLSTTGLYGIPAVRQANVEADGEIRAGNPYFELAAAVPYALIENTLGITPLKTMRAFSGGAAPAGIAKTIAANAGKIGSLLEKPLFELSGKAGIKGTVGAFSRFVAEIILGEATEEVFQAIEETAIPHFAKKPIDQAIRDTMADLGKPEVVDLLTQAKGGALVGGVLGGANSIARKITSISDQINDPKTTPEEAQKLAAAKKQLKDEMLQLTYNQNIPTVQPSGPIIKDPTAEGFQEPEGELIHPQQTFGGPAPEILYPDAQPPQNIGTEGTMRDYAAYQQDKQAALEEQNATPIAVLRKIAAMKSVPDSDPRKQRFMKFLADRNWLPQEATEYPSGRVGQELQALDAAEMMPETLVSAEATPETPLLPYQQNQAEGRILADNGGVVLPVKTEDFVMPKSGRPFANQKIARAYQTKNSMKDTHDITPVRGGFALMRKPTQQQNVRRVAVETPRGGAYEKLDVRTEKNIPTENRTRFTGTPGAAERIEKRLPQQQQPAIMTPAEKIASAKDENTRKAILEDYNRYLEQNKAAYEEYKSKPEAAAKIPNMQNVIKEYESVKAAVDQTTIKQPVPVAEPKAIKKAPAPAEPIKQSTLKAWEMTPAQYRAANMGSHNDAEALAAARRGEKILAEIVDIYSLKNSLPQGYHREGDWYVKTDSPVTKSVYKVESYQGGFRVLDPENKQYSWHTSREAAESKAADLNSGKVAPVKSEPKPEAKPETTTAQPTTRITAENAAVLANAQKLRKSAASLIEQAQAELSRERQTNTARRARMAAGATDRAAESEAFAKTMNNLADAMERGEVKYLKNINSRAGLGLFKRLFDEARYRYGQKNDILWDKQKDIEMTDTVIRSGTEFNRPQPYGNWFDYAAQELEKIQGMKSAAAYVEKLGRGSRDRNVSLSDEAITRILDIKKAITQKGIKMPYQFARILETIEDYQKLRAAGIKSDFDLADALIEYRNLKAGKKQESPLIKAERELIGKKFEGFDFFPTPPALAERMAQELDIKPGMKVLEPSAGKGDLADAVKAAQPEADVKVIEPLNDLREILTMKNHEVIDTNFENFETDQRFDRIIMNPPFSKNRDIRHVRKAYELLAPGGKMIAIMGNHSTFANDKESVEFRDWLDKVGGTSENLGQAFAGKDAFRQTGVNSQLVTIEKPSAKSTSAKPDSRKFYNGDEITFEYPDGREFTATVEDATPRTIDGTPDQIYVQVDVNNALRYIPKSWVKRLSGMKGLERRRVESQQAEAATEAARKTGKPILQQQIDAIRVVYEKYGKQDPKQRGFIGALKKVLAPLGIAEWKINSAVESARNENARRNSAVMTGITDDQIIKQLADTGDLAKPGQTAGPDKTVKSLAKSTPAPVRPKFEPTPYPTTPGATSLTPQEWEAKNQALSEGKVFSKVIDFNELFKTFNKKNKDVKIRFEDIDTGRRDKENNPITVTGVVVRRGKYKSGELEFDRATQSFVGTQNVKNVAAELTEMYKDFRPSITAEKAPDVKTSLPPAFKRPPDVTGLWGRAPSSAEKFDFTQYDDGYSPDGNAWVVVGGKAPANRGDITRVNAAPITRTISDYAVDLNAPPAIKLPMMSRRNNIDNTVVYLVTDGKDAARLIIGESVSAVMPVTDGTVNAEKAVYFLYDTLREIQSVVGEISLATINTRKAEISSRPVGQFVAKDGQRVILLTAAEPAQIIERKEQGRPLFSIEYLIARAGYKAVRSGFNLLRSGITKFADWAKGMLKQFGSKIGKQLRAMYADLQAFNKQLGKEGMIKMGSLGRPGFQRMAVVPNSSRRYLRFEHGAVYADDMTMPTPRTITNNLEFLSRDKQNMANHRRLGSIANARFKAEQEAAIAEARAKDPAWREFLGISEKTYKDNEAAQLIAEWQAENGNAIFSVEYLVARYAKKGLNNAATIVKKGFDHIRSGLTQFAKWARQMVNEFGQTIRKHLRNLWTDLTAVSQSRRGMIRIADWKSPKMIANIQRVSDTANARRRTMREISSVYTDMDFRREASVNRMGSLSQPMSDDLINRLEAVGATPYDDNIGPARRRQANARFRAQQAEAYAEIAAREITAPGSPAAKEASEAFFKEWADRFGSRRGAALNLSGDAMTLFLNGATKFADWARALVKRYGKSVTGMLKSLWSGVNSFAKSLGRTGAISGRPASTVTGKTTGQVLNRIAKMKDFQWKKENFRTVHLEYTSPDTGKVTRVAKLLKVNNKWFWADTNREFLTLATATKTVKSEIFEKVRNTEREQVKLIEEARARRTAKQAKATKKVEAYLSQPSAAEEVTKKELPVTVADKISTYADRVTRALFDRRLMLKKVQKLIELVSGKPLPDWANPYERFDVIDGRIETNKNEFKDKFWQPLMDLLDKAKISYEDFNNFVYAMHAPERNKYINEINPGFREKKVPGSGWSDEKAAQVKNELFAKYGEDTLMEAGKMFWGMHSELLNKQVEYGLIDDEVKQIIDAKYQYYTPLKRIKDDSIVLDARALGRRSEAQDQLMFSLAAIDTTFGRGEHNRVMQAFARMALTNPAEQFYEIQKDKLKPYFDERTGEVQYRLDLWADRESTVHAKFGGRDVAIVIKDKDLLNAIKTKSSEAEPLFQLLRPINKIISSVNTAFNPDFILTNIFRDIQTAGVHASDSKSWEMAKGILASVPGSVKTSWQHHRGIDNENTRMYKEFLREGGKTGYSEIYQLQDLAEKLEKEMAERQANSAWYQTKRGIGRFMDAVAAGNDIAESATRFAGYQAARKSGMTAQKAAAFAKNLTINFNKKGTYGTIVNTAYVFGNAALQGSYLTARLTWNMAKTNKGRIALASMIALGAMSDFLNRLISDFDDEEGRSYYDKISSDVKDNNFIIMLPGTGGNYISFPMAYGLNILPALGRNASSYLFGDQTLRETAMNILGVGMGAFNPMGNDNRGLLANLTPTALKPLHDLTTNTKWSGRRIRPDQPVFGADLPQSELYFDQTSKPLVKFTQWLNEAFGGNKYESSSFLTDLSPADMQHLIEAFSGGVGKTIVRGYDTVDRVVSGNPVQVENVPVIRRFIGKARDFNVYDEFRANAQIAKRAQAAKSGDDTEWLRNNRESVRVNEMFKNVEKAMAKLRKNSSLSDEARKEKELLLQKRFNKNVRDIMQKNLSKN